MAMVISLMVYVVEEDQESARLRLTMLPQDAGLVVFHSRQIAQEALEHFRQTTKTPLQIWSFQITVSAEYKPEN